jgi:hypothetical protein
MLLRAAVVVGSAREVGTRDRDNASDASHGTESWGGQISRRSRAKLGDFRFAIGSLLGTDFQSGRYNPPLIDNEIQCVHLSKKWGVATRSKITVLQAQSRVSVVIDEISATQTRCSACPRTAITETQECHGRCSLGGFATLYTISSRATAKDSSPVAVPGYKHGTVCTFSIMPSSINSPSSSASMTYSTERRVTSLPPSVIQISIPRSR